MPTSPLNNVIPHLLADLKPAVGGMTDGEILARFLKCRDEEVLAALVRRHAGMVWGVCRRLLHNHHDAEDAFQATFLVLVRKAAAVPRQGVASWLYGVARQTAVRQRATAAKRGRRETQVGNMPESTVLEVRDADMQRVVDEALSRLPGHYRGVVILCDMEGMTRREAARHLGIPEGSVASRLARARAMLARSLKRWGIVLSGSVVAALSAGAAPAPPTLVASTIKAASLLATGQMTGVVSAEVSALTEGVLRTMFMTKFKIAAAVVLVLVSLTGGTGFIYHLEAAQETTGEVKEQAAVKRAEEPDGEKGEKAKDLQRRLAQLEQQLKALTTKIDALQKKLDAAAGKSAKTEAKVIPLRERKVEEVAQTLWNMYRSKEGKEIRIGMDAPTNSLIVVASPNDIEMVETIVKRLEILPKKEQNKDKGER
jgi:RNA polymerase sigma factor (sigma-70 family)